MKQLTFHLNQTHCQNCTNYISYYIKLAHKMHKLHHGFCKRVKRSKDRNRLTETCTHFAMLNIEAEKKSEQQKLCDILTNIHKIVDRLLQAILAD